MKESNLKLYNNETLKLHGKYVKKRLNDEFQNGLIDIQKDGDSISFDCSFLQDQLLIEEKKKLRIKTNISIVF